MGWCHAFKLHPLCNATPKIITLILNPKHTQLFLGAWKVLTKYLYDKEFADRGYITQKFFEVVFNQSFHFVHELRSNMKPNSCPCVTK